MQQTPNNGLPPSPSLSPSHSKDMLARKTSYNQLTQNSLAAIPDASAGYGIRQASVLKSNDVEVGDMVNTPGGMHGTVKFIGNVKNKLGVFVGVELEGELAGKGKNDGAVDGVRYFKTTEPMSGIFVPLARASKRNSIDSSQTPPTPTLLSSPNGLSALSPPTLVPGRIRSESPASRAFNTAISRTPARLPSRSESPMRRPTLVPPPTTPRNVSVPGSRIGALSPTPNFGKMGFGTPRLRAGSVGGAGVGVSTVSVAGSDGRPGTSGGQRSGTTTPKSQFGLGLKHPKSSVMLRSGSSIGFRPNSSLDRHLEEPVLLPSSPIESSFGISKPDDIERGGGEDPKALKQQLSEKDRQLQEQAMALLDMESTLTELQSLVQTASNGPSGITSPRSGPFEDADSAQLRALLREKNEKIQHLTAEFDAHRADFRSTIDTLELASSETERVYEKRVEDLLSDIRELQYRNEDVESVARQLKQLEELVQELEEGLEDARRGEAEARGEVEFLRGEVERSREELRREREKSAAAVANAAVGKMMRNGTSDEVEKKDDEIRGLKAIIHSLSRDSVALDDVAANGAAAAGAMSGLDHSASYPNGVRRFPLDGELVKERQNSEKLHIEITELQNQIKNKVNREEELEREIEELRKKKEARSSSCSEKTITPWGGSRISGDRDSRSTVSSWRSRHASRSGSGSSHSTRPVLVDTSLSQDIVSEEKDDGELTPIDSDADSTVPWCEICEAAGHDILTCTNMFGTGAGGPASAGPNGSTTAAAAAAADEMNKKNDVQSPPVRRKDSISTFAADAPSGNPPESCPAPPTTEELGVQNDSSSGAETTKKTVYLPHLPPPLPMLDSVVGPLAGKESEKIEMDKWCAMCERDGHDSVDCPVEMDY